MSKDIEARFVPVEEIRSERTDAGLRLMGYAATFNSLSANLGGFREEIAPMAFTRSLKEDDVVALWNHDPGVVLGRTKSGTLKLKTDERGLHFTLALPDTQGGRDVATLVERGDVRGMSFGFIKRDHKWSMRDGEAVRTLLDVQLQDVSPVAMPAYSGTEVALRSLEAARAAGDVEGEKRDEPPAEEPKQDEPETPDPMLALERQRLLLAEVEQDIA